MAETQKRIRIVRPVEDQEEPKAMLYEDEGHRLLYDEEDLNPEVGTLPVHQLLAKLDALQPYLEAHFYGNPRGHSFKAMMSRKRRARRAKVLKLLDEIRDAIKYDDFLAQTDAGSYL
jgi:hypothetical protein